MTVPHIQQPDWRVLLIDGSSGTGKSTLARSNGRHFSVPSVQIDDFRMALQYVTTRDQHPALHLFISSAGVARESIWRLPPDALCDGLIGVAQVVSQALEIIIAHHVSSGDPIVIESDGILPAMAAQRVFAGYVAGNRVRALFLSAPDEDLILSDTGIDEPGCQEGATEDYRTQTQMNWLYGQWLRRKAERYDLPVIATLPRATVVDRALAVIA